MSSAAGMVSTTPAAAHSASLFQTGWFVESLITQALVIHVIRTNQLPFVQSRASRPVIAIGLVVIAIGIALPLSPVGRYPRIHGVAAALLADPRRNARRVPRGDPGGEELATATPLESDAAGRGAPGAMTGVRIRSWALHAHRGGAQDGANRARPPGAARRGDQDAETGTTSGQNL